MNKIVGKNLSRLLLLFFIQVLILKQIQIGGHFFNYISLFIYPLFLLLLPLKTPKITLVLIGFGLGILMDLFYDSPGVHAGACLATAFFRPILLAIIEPREGYNVNFSPTMRKYGFIWFLKYAGILYLIHLLVYFSYEIFTPHYFTEILLRTVFSFIVSMIIVIVYMFVFNPKE